MVANKQKFINNIVNKLLMILKKRFIAVFISMYCANFARIKNYPIQTYSKVEQE